MMTTRVKMINRQARQDLLEKYRPRILMTEAELAEDAVRMMIPRPPPKQCFGSLFCFFFFFVFFFFTDFGFADKVVPLALPKKLKIGIFKLLPKIVIVPVLSSPEHLEFSPILQKWPRALHFISVWNSDCKSGIGYFIPPKVGHFWQFRVKPQKCPTLGIQKWHFWWNEMDHIWNPWILNVKFEILESPPFLNLAKTTRQAGNNMMSNDIAKMLWPGYFIFDFCYLKI